MAVVLSPTRELAVQIMDVLQNVLRAHTHIVPGCVIGGEKKKSEKVWCEHGIRRVLCQLIYMKHINENANVCGRG